MKKFLTDFKAFAMRGNVLDMAIGVIIGGAFGKIVTSLVSDIITPLISMLLNTSEMVNWTVGVGTNAAGEAVNLRYGLFLQNIIDFLLIALSIFVVLKLLMRFKKEKQEEEIIQKSAEVELLEEIRDALKNK